MPGPHNPPTSPPRTLYLYLHRPGRDVQVIEVLDPQARIRDLITVGADLVFLDDEAEPVDAERALADLLTGRHRRLDVHRHPCRSVDVRVAAGGRPVQVPAAPSSRIGTVRLAAMGMLGLGGGDDHALRAAGADHELPDSAYLADLPDDGRCRLDLDLVRRGTPAR